MYNEMTEKWYEDFHERWRGFFGGLNPYVTSVRLRNLVLEYGIQPPSFNLYTETFNHQMRVFEWSFMQ